MIFRISAAAELAPRVLTRRSDSIAVPRLPRLRRGLGIPEILKLHWLKSTFAAKTSRVILIHIASGWLGLDLSRAWRQGAGTVARLSRSKAERRQPTRAQFLPRRGKTSVPARTKTRQTRKLILYKLTNTKK